MPLFLRLCRGGRTSENSSISAARHTAFSSPGRAFPEDDLDKEKVLLFRENQPKFAKWQGIDCLFVENTQSLFEKGKTDVQGAENRQLKQIDMAQMSNCDKIKIDMHFRVTIIRIVQQQ